MPHVIVKMWLGKSEKQKRELDVRIAKDVRDLLEREQTGESATYA